MKENTDAGNKEWRREAYMRKKSFVIRCVCVCRVKPTTQHTYCTHGVESSRGCAVVIRRGCGLKICLNLITLSYTCSHTHTQVQTHTATQTPAAQSCWGSPWQRAGSYFSWPAESQVWFPVNPLESFSKTTHPLCLRCGLFLYRLMDIRPANMTINVARADVIWFQSLSPGWSSQMSGQLLSTISILQILPILIVALSCTRTDTKTQRMPVTLPPHSSC